MSERKISYLNRTFEDYQKSLKNLIKTNYPDIAADFDDASIGSWLIDLVAAIGDNLSYHIDSVFSETNLESAKQSSSVMNIARSNGFKVPGPKGGMAEIKFTLNYFPISDTAENTQTGDVYMPNFYYSPIIKRGTILKSNSGQYFETVEDIDFSEQFNNEGVSDRTIIPYTNTNDNGIIRYVVTKTGICVGGITNTYTEVISESNVKPFYEVVLPYTDIIEVESIIFKTGNRYNETPDTNDFFIQTEFKEGTDDTPDIYRFFEVNSLLDQYRWGDDISTNIEGNQDTDKPITYYYGYRSQTSEEYIPCYSVTKGMWIPLTQKFITEYTDEGYLKIIFGAGEEPGHNLDYVKDATDFSKNQMSKMVRNNSLGKSIVGGTTMFIRYRRGGGYSSNVPANTINTISYLNYESKFDMCTTKDKNIAGNIKNSLTVTNTTPSISGKDMPTVEEIKQMIKYSNSELERCVTVKDYQYRVSIMPSRYGCPFRVGGMENNNKIMLYLLNVDNEGKLTDVLPTVMTNNIQSYLSMYRTINDYIEIKPGRIINVSFNIDMLTDKNYDTSYVVKQVLTTVEDYMDINKHYLGEDIYIGDLMKEISKIDGVLNLISLKVYNIYGSDGSSVYSDTQTSQTTYSDDTTSDNGAYKLRIDLDESDLVLYSEADEMFEIKYPENDIIVTVKSR